MTGTEISTKGSNKLSLALFTWMMWALTTAYRLTEYAKRHFVLMGASLGLITGLVVELFDSSSTASVVDLAMTALYGGLAAWLWVVSLRRFTLYEWTKREICIRAIRMSFALLYSVAVPLTVLDGWTNVFHWLAGIVGALVLYVVLLHVLSLLSFTLPQKLLEVVRSEMATCYLGVTNKFETGPVGRWLCLPPRSDAVRE